MIRLFSCLIDKADLAIRVQTPDGDDQVVPVRRFGGALPVRMAQPAPQGSSAGARATVPLIALAHGRSGDKGDIANIGILARMPEFWPILHAELTAERVREALAHYVRGVVERFEWPGLMGFNFVLHQALGGGGMASLRHDPQGKALAQVLMDLPIAVPAGWCAPGGLLAGRAIAVEKGETRHHEYPAFSKVLIANRGEIACRVIRTLDAMGIASVAIHHAVERGARHVRMAGEAVMIHGDTPVAAHLDATQIIAAAKATGAEAIHPGYGFLSENAGSHRR